MQKRIPIKNHQLEIQLVTRRSLVAFAIILSLIFGLIARLAYLQIAKKDLYATLSANNSLDLVPIEPTRGLIFDRHGVMLAENVPVFSLDVIPNDVQNLDRTLTALSKLISLSDNDIAQFRRQLKQHRRFDEIPLKLKLTEEEVARFAENQYRFQGVLVRARLMRRYPFGNTFSHVLGYVGRINAQELNQIDPVNYSASHYIGKLGIEKFYEEELHGTVGYEQVENDAGGKPIRTLKEINGTPGKNLYLTLDSGLQFAAENALGDKRGAVVAIQPSTGQVLAMVSKPGFDPNIFVTGISQPDYQALANSQDRPLFDRTIRGVYPFASTIKPYYALQGLATGTVTTDYTIYDPGWFQTKNNAHRYRDWRPHGHGSVDISRAVTASCDTYFFNLASKMGLRRMVDILSQFGFGAQTGIDLDNELPGLLGTPEWKQKARGQKWYEADTIMGGIGQGYMQVTPLQMAVGVATIANRGNRFMPYLLLGDQQPGEHYIAQQPIPLDPVKGIDPAMWDTVITAMQNVIESPMGTGYRFGKNRPYTLAAKTGTAQLIAAHRANENEVDKQENVAERLRDHHLLIVFAPVDNPQIALGIITENSYATIETARNILDYFFGNEPHVRQPEAEIKKTAT